MKKFIMTFILSLLLTVASTPTQAMVKENVNLDSIVEWVYNNSRNKSYETSRLIVNHTFKTARFPYLMLAIFKKESSFLCTSVSKEGACGIGQVMPSHSKRLQRLGIINNKKELKTIIKGINASIFIFEEYLFQTKDFHKALSLYLGARSKKYNKIVLSDSRTLQQLGENHGKLGIYATR